MTFLTLWNQLQACSKTVVAVEIDRVYGDTLFYWNPVVEYGIRYQFVTYEPDPDRNPQNVAKVYLEAASLASLKAHPNEERGRVLAHVRGDKPFYIRPADALEVSLEVSHWDGLECKKSW
jgi:hypothetical protein